MERFDPPGYLEDLSEGDRARWSDWISRQLDAAAAGRPDLYDFDAPRPRFFNPLAAPPDDDATEKDISWKAFPRTLEIEAGTDAQRWAAADATRDVQDEYCEWSVDRDSVTGAITRVTFTSEGPEYWEFLAHVDLPKVLELYRTHVSARVQKQDLIGADGRYNPRNRWNASTSGGAMHLIQVNNTLSAEIELAAAATNVRTRDGVPLSDPRALIECGRYGAIERHSDPHIGAEVNALARAGADVALADPIGLYIAGLNVAGWEAPDGSDPLSYWSIVRGTAAKALRAVYAVPAAKGFTVSDVTINGRPIRFGAQIADFITIKLTGLATRFGRRDVPALAGCKRRRPGGNALAAAAGVEDVLTAARPRTR